MLSTHWARSYLRCIAVPAAAAGLVLAGVPAQAAPLSIACGNTADLVNAINVEGGVPCGKVA